MGMVLVLRDRKCRGRDRGPGPEDCHAMDWEKLLNTSLLGNAASEWALALMVASGVWGALFFARGLLRRRFSAIAERTQTPIDDAVVRVLSHTRWFFLLAISVYAAVPFVELADRVSEWVERGVLLCAALQVGAWASASIRIGIEIWMASRPESAAGQSTTVATAIRFAFNAIVWGFVFVFALSNVGIEVSALLAGLGVGGIAVALALQNVLGDLFASVSIYLDRPFDIGDFIVLDDLKGTVEKVGLQSSRIRSLTGEEIIIPNRSLIDQRIKNMRRLPERRSIVKIGVTYDTAAGKLGRVPQLVAESVARAAPLKLERCHFVAYGDFSLVFEFAITIDTGDYVKFLDAQHALYLELHRVFESNEIEFAFPTQTLHLVSPASRGVAVGVS